MTYMIIYNSITIKYKTDYFILKYIYNIFVWQNEDKRSITIGIPLQLLTNKEKKYLENLDNKLSYIPNIKFALEINCPCDTAIINDKLKELYNKEELQQFNNIYKKQKEYINNNIKNDMKQMEVIEKYLLGI